jgi:trehalose 6-phosphate synthase/phosphatase
VSSGRLIVVANRLPLTLRAAGVGWTDEPSPGGLVTALGPILKRTGGLWIGWAGEGEGPPTGRRERLQTWEEHFGYVAVELPRLVAQRYYHGYANQTLWPLFHQFPSRLEFNPEGWDAYVEANRRFRDAVLERLRPGDRIWVHDYHLMLLPQLLREAVPEATIGFFLHIPFPPSDLFRVLPRREELLRGALGADLIAFQTHLHLQHFRASLLRILGLGSRMDRVTVEGRFSGLEALPIGIVPEEFLDPLDRDPAVTRALGKLRRRFRGRRLMLAVDRLDYTKGIPERLRAYRRLLEGASRLRGRVVLIQIAVPSRDRIPRYGELRSEVNQVVGEINGDFGTPDWTPVIYIRRSVPRPELVALYRAADVGWVTPLRDGMNLVAKEYAACQRGAAGVLVLSEFAGAAAEMGEALLVNPYDEERTAAAVERALSLPVEERRERMAALFGRVARNNAFAWSERFLRSLERAAGARALEATGPASPLPVDALAAAFRHARRRLLLLDYDGTLVPFADRPQDAAPPRQLLAILRKLTAAPAQRVAIVSGRPRHQLESFLGGVPGLWLGAEHGAVVRAPGAATWQALRPRLPTEWKERVRPVLEHFVNRAPGSFLEEKEFSLVWHYRMSDPEFGEWLANELVANLEEMLAETELRAVRGHRSVEVRLAWANKGEVVARLEQDGFAPDLYLALGDDVTDEDLFERLPPEAWTVRVGEGPSRARFRLGGPASVIDVLRALPVLAAVPGTKEGHWAGRRPPPAPGTGCGAPARAETRSVLSTRRRQA